MTARLSVLGPEPSSSENGSLLWKRQRSSLTRRSRWREKFHGRFAATCEWELGELIAYRLLSGDFIVFQVIGHHTDAGGVAPVCEIFEWRGREIPQPSELEGVQTRAQIPLVFKNSPPQPSPAPRPQYLLMIGQVSKREFPKDRAFRRNAKPPIPVHDSLNQRYAPTLECLWRTLDRELEMHYNLR